MGRRAARTGNRHTRATEPNEFGRRLRALVEASPHYATLQDFLADLGVSHTSFYRWETTDTRPRGKHLSRMADLLGTTADYLISGRAAEPEIQRTFDRYVDVARRYAARILEEHAHPDAIPPEKRALLRRLVKLHPLFAIVIGAENEAQAMSQRAALDTSLPLILAPPNPSFGDFVRAGVEAKLAEDRANLLREHPELVDIFRESGID